MRILRHLLAIGLLPGMVTLLVPALLVSGDEVASWPPALLGAALIALGLALMAQTIALFATVGDGTLAPWDPTARLVVRGPYRRVRNPMISGVLCVLLGEALLFGSPALLAWSALFFAVNAVWFPLVEEPGLRQRFGADYEAYRAAVPRWLPRLRPWTSTLARLPRLADAALGEQAVEQQQERLVRRRAVARLRVRGVAPGLEPARVRAGVEADEPRAIGMPEQAGAPPARRQRGRRAQLDAVRAH